MTRLDICLFGLPRFSLDAAPLKFERRKTLALLTYLACQAGEGAGSGLGCSREVLSALFWPEASQDQAGAYLRQTLWDFSKAAGEGWIERDGPAVRFRAEADLWIDVQVFERLIKDWKTAPPESSDPQAARVLEDAIQLYTGDFLAGFSLRDCPEFDEWQTRQAEGLRLAMGEALEGLVRLYGEQSRYDDGINAARRWLALDELNEPAHRALMRLLDTSGQRSAALRQFEACQKRLQTDLGVMPEPATLQLFQQISARRTTASTPAESRRMPPPVRPPVPVYLPPQATPFLGREDELSQIQGMLANPECRLITLVGPGGSGKTRLSIQAAGQSIGYPQPLSFPHGIFFAGLTNANTMEEALLLIASALKMELRVERGQNLSAEAARGQLLGFLSEKKSLLVLDNLEQLVESEHGQPVGLFSEMLSAAPGLKLIATSRVRLALPEEWVLEVGGLPFPVGTRSTPAQTGSTPPDPSIQQYSAVQLFVKIAERTGSFHPSEADWPDIARICQLVDGLPLGVELAAAWVKMLSVQEIAGEIARDLDFLEAQRPGIPERHHSLRAVFEYSWRLLRESERSIFRRLAIFRGGFSREAAFQVAGASLKQLSGFVDRSLLRRVSSGRFDLHELVKQYAAEKLAEDAGARLETEERHARYYAEWLHLKGVAIRGPDQMAILTALRGEMQNIRQSWHWLVGQHGWAWIDPILTDMILFFEMHGDYPGGSEAMQLLADELRAAPPADEITRGSLTGLALAGVRHFKRGEDSEAQSIARQSESLGFASRLPANSHARGYILMLNALGPGKLPGDQVLGMCRESAEIFAAAGDLWSSGLAYLILGDSANFGGLAPEQACPAYETSLAIFSQLGDDWGRALCCYGLSVMAIRRSDLKEAENQVQQSLAIYERMNNMNRILDTRSLAAEIALMQGHKEKARQYWQTNQLYYEQAGDHPRSQYYANRIKETM